MSTTPSIPESQSTYPAAGALSQNPQKTHDAEPRAAGTLSRQADTLSLDGHPLQQPSFTVQPPDNAPRGSARSPLELHAPPA